MTSAHEPTECPEPNCVDGKAYTTCPLGIAKCTAHYEVWFHCENAAHAPQPAAHRAGEAMKHSNVSTGENTGNEPLPSQSDETAQPPAAGEVEDVFSVKSRLKDLYLSGWYDRDLFDTPGTRYEQALQAIEAHYNARFEAATADLQGHDKSHADEAWYASKSGGAADGE